jgi:ubiquinone/menaquinone biosynthesis C-methylase UbiE
VDFLGYDAAELAALPTSCTASFAGIGNPHSIAPILPGETVLDIGCGAGMDLLIAARRVGPGGRAIGLDMTEAMRDRACTSAAKAGLTNVEVNQADATSLPLPDASIDVVISNGVLNLVPEKEKAFAEIRRVLRPGGRLQIADIVLDAELGDEVRRNIDLWTG